MSIYVQYNTICTYLSDVIAVILAGILCGVFVDKTVAVFILLWHGRYTQRG